MADSYPIVEDVAFKLITGFPDYCVGTNGSIWSRRRQASWMKLTPFLDKDGRPRVELCSGTKRRTFYVSSIVLEAFVGPRPDGFQACHFPDRTVTNNSASNLMWGSRATNHSHRIIHGTMSCKSTLNEADVIEIRRLAISGTSAKSIAQEFGISYTSAKRVIRRHHWKHVI
jgi:hypothetical protein